MKNVCNRICSSWDPCILLGLITIITLFTPEPTVHPRSPPTLPSPHWHPSISLPLLSPFPLLLYSSPPFLYSCSLTVWLLVPSLICTSSPCPRFYLYIHLQTPAHTCTHSKKEHFLSASEELLKKPYTSTNRKRVRSGWSSCYWDDSIKVCVQRNQTRNFLDAEPKQSSHKLQKIKIKNIRPS